jgi:FMN phosphatase YigB (HAD superfamily)
MTVRAVTFDCWGTLINDTSLERTFDIRVTALVEAGNGALDAGGARALFERGWQEHHRSWVGGVQYGASGIARFCAAELGAEDPLVCDRLQEAFEEAGRHGSLYALPGAANALAALRAAGIRTALVCDTGLTPGRVVRDFLGDLGLLENLEFCAFSDEVGEPKPNPGIFRAALAAIDTEPRSAAHVGDLLRTDIHGARAIGMKTVRITAVNDDLATRFSWDSDASFGSTRSDGNAMAEEIVDADQVVSSYVNLPQALRKLGAAL